MDGTLTRPTMNFAALKAEMGLDEAMAVLEQLREVEEQEPQRLPHLLQILYRFEHEAALIASANHGAVETVNKLHDSGLRSAIVTRNSKPFTEMTLARIGLKIDVLVTREDAAPKPSPEPVLLACARLGLPPEKTWMVGDYVHDLEAGQSAGCAATVLITNNRPPGFDHQATHVIHQLNELLPLLHQFA